MEKAPNDVDAKHRHDVLVLERAVLAGNDVPLLARVAQHRLRVAVCSPVGHSELRTVIPLDVRHRRILKVIVGRHRHEGGEPVHRVARLIQPVPFEEDCIRPSQLPWFHLRGRA